MRLEEALEALLALEPYLAGPNPQRTALVETLGRIALATPTGISTHRIYIISDGREVSPFGDFECRDPDADLDAHVFRERVLDASSFSGATVDFVYVGHRPVTGRNCPVPISRMRAIQEAWTGLLTAAGAAHVTFHTDSYNGLPPS